MPYSLIVSYCFLKQNFPKARIILATSVNDIIETGNNYDFLLLSPHLTPFLKNNHYDLFINVCSMGEMNNSCINYWKNFLTNVIRVDHVFLLNRFMNEMSELYDFRRNENTSSVWIPDTWNIIHWELDPDLQRTPFIDAHAPKYLFIIANTQPQIKTLNEKQGKSLQLLREALLQDWARDIHDGIYPGPPERILGLHQFNGDMNGALFKLWEAVRIYPTQLNIMCLLKYLNFCRSAFHPKLRFEEEHYYQTLLNEQQVQENIYLDDCKDIKNWLSTYSLPKCQPQLAFELSTSESYQNLQTRYDQLQKEYHGLLNSRSWKITAPLRNIKSLLISRWREISNN